MGEKKSKLVKECVRVEKIQIKIIRGGYYTIEGYKKIEYKRREERMVMENCKVGLMQKQERKTIKLRYNLKYEKIIVEGLPKYLGKKR